MLGARSDDGCPSNVQQHRSLQLNLIRHWPSHGRGQLRWNKLWWYKCTSFISKGKLRIRPLPSPFCIIYSTHLSSSILYTDFPLNSCILCHIDCTLIDCKMFNIKHILEKSAWMTSISDIFQVVRYRYFSTLLVWDLKFRRNVWIQVHCVQFNADCKVQETSKSKIWQCSCDLLMYAWSVQLPRMCICPSVVAVSFLQLKKH